MIRKAEIDFMKMTEEQEYKINKCLRKYCPFKAIKWTEESDIKEG